MDSVHRGIRQKLEQQNGLRGGTQRKQAHDSLSEPTGTTTPCVPSDALRAMLLGLMLGIACGSGIAQDYPTRPIRVIVGFSAGSTTDILARTVGQKINEAWGQPVLVDNRPSAGGIVAANAVATAAPDGYTLLVVSAGHAATAAMFSKLPYDTLKDFAGVSRIANVPSILVVSPALGIKSVKDLVALAKARPGQLNFSSPGVGSANHLAGGQCPVSEPRRQVTAARHLHRETLRGPARYTDTSRSGGLGLRVRPLVPHPGAGENAQSSARQIEQRDCAYRRTTGGEGTDAHGGRQVPKDRSGRRPQA